MSFLRVSVLWSNIVDLMSVSETQEIPHKHLWNKQAFSWGRTPSGNCQVLCLWKNWSWCHPRMQLLQQACRSHSTCQSVIELDDGTTVTIIRDAVTRSRTKVPIRKKQVYAKQTRRSTDRIFTSKNKRLEPESRTWVKAKTAQSGLIMLKTLPRLHDKHNFLAGASVYQAKPGNEFGILIANVSSKLVYLTEGQDVEKAAKHPVTLMESTMIRGEMHGVVETKTVYITNETGLLRQVCSQHILQMFEKLPSAEPTKRSMKKLQTRLWREISRRNSQDAPQL